MTDMTKEGNWTACSARQMSAFSGASQSSTATFPSLANRCATWSQTVVLQQTHPPVSRGSKVCYILSARGWTLTWSQCATFLAPGGLARKRNNLRHEGISGELNGDLKRIWGDAQLDEDGKRIARRVSVRVPVVLVQRNHAARGVMC
jgi:hypothetical protein